VIAAGLSQLAGRPRLPSFLAAVQGPLDHYGLWAIGLLLLLENIGVPVIPGEFAMIAGAIYAGAGQLNIVAVGVVSFAAAVVGATIGYLIGRLAGRALVLRYGRYAFIREHHLAKAEQTVDKYGGIVVVVARYIVGLRELNGIICGVSGMNPVTFTTYNIIGGAAWVGTWVSAGYFAGDHIAAIYDGVTRYALYVIIAAVVVLTVWIAVRLRRRRQARQLAAPAEAKSDLRGRGQAQRAGCRCHRLPGGRRR
jgi:membrane protein DedA with SNARE-associated domain